MFDTGKDQFRRSPTEIHDTKERACYFKDSTETLRSNMASETHRLPKHHQPFDRPAKEVKPNVCATSPILGRCPPPPTPPLRPTSFTMPRTLVME